MTRLSSSRRLLPALVLVLFGLLALWWLRRDRDDDAGGDVARDDTAVAGLATRRARVDGSEAGEATVSRLRWRQGGASVQGRVLAESGEAIAGASVCAQAEGQRVPSALSREPWCTTSDNAGRYAIGNLPALAVRVSASAPTYQPGAHDPPGPHDTIDLLPGQAATEIDVTLRSGGVEIHGVVKDIAGGVIEGAIVSGTSDWRGGRATTRSDAQGAFHLWVGPGEAQVWATAEGYTDGWQGGPSPGFTFEILLTPEAVLAGRVVDREGRPVADARVSAESGMWSQNTSYTDAEGAFRIDRLEPGRYKPMAQAPEGFALLGESIRLGIGQTVDGIELRLSPMASVRGRIVIAGREPTPCANGEVQLQDANGGMAAYARSDADGRVELLAVAPDRYRVEIGCDGYLPRASYPPLVVDGADVEAVWEVDVGREIVGVVTDEDGKPIRDATVRAAPSGAKGREQRSYAFGEATDASGRFVLRGLTPGSYSLRASHDDYVTPLEPVAHEIPAAGAGEMVQLALSRGGEVRGRVVDEDQRPVPHTEVSLRGKEYGGRAMTGDDGRFTITAVRPGTHRVVASRGWSQQMRAPGSTDDDIQGTSVEVRAGEVVEVELRVEGQFGRISGTVVDADGNAVDDAFIQSEREPDSIAANASRARGSVRWAGWTAAPVLADQDGAFVLDALAKGKHTLMAMRKGGGEGIVEHVETGATGVVIEIADGGRIAGSLALSSGGAPERFSISVSCDAQGFDRREDFFATAGAWSFAELPAGTYSISAEAREGVSTTSVELARGKDVADVALVLTPRVDVTGTVVDIDTGEPVSGMQISIEPRKGGGFSFSMGGGADEEYVSDASGAFRVPGAPAGAVRITVIPKDFFMGEVGYGFARIAATIPADVATHRLPPLRIVKERTRRGQRPGDLGFKLVESAPGTEPEDAVRKVAFIRPGGPASHTELAVGDEIVEVDGRPVTGDDAYLYGVLTRLSPGGKVTLGTGGGKTVTIVAGDPL